MPTPASPDSDHELRTSAGDAHAEHVIERRQLHVAAHERRGPPHPTATGRRERLDRAEGVDRFAPPGQALRAELFVADHGPRRGEGGRADDDLARRGELLEPLRRVHDVTHHRRVAARAHRSDQHLAGVHADPHLHRDAELRCE